MEEKKAVKTTKRIEMPHILILIPCLLIFFSALTYVLPGGTYEFDEAGRVIPGTFTPGASIPFSPWKALLSIREGVMGAGSTISMMLINAGAVAVILKTECFEDIMNYSVYKLQDKSVKVMVPAIVVIMSLLGAFAGGDSLIMFVSVGLVICAKLKLDRICAMAMFYLGYLIGQGASFTSSGLIIVQQLAGVEPLSDMLVRIPVWIIFTTINAAYCTRYALKICGNASKSYVGEILEETEGMEEIKTAVLPVRSILLAVLLFATFIGYAIGSKAYGWGMDYLCGFVIIMDVIAVIISGMKPNTAAATFFKGSQSMGGICVVIGAARVIGTIITKSTIVYSMANAASVAVGQLGVGFACITLFIFILLFNLLIPSMSSKAAILLPLLCPICDVIGLPRGLLVTIYMMGDSLTNTLTPVSGPLCGSLGLASVEYQDWVKYSAPLMALLALAGGCYLIGLVTLGIFA